MRADAEEFKTPNKSASFNLADESRIKFLVGYTIAQVERILILHSLESCHGNRTRAAKLLGISVRSLRNKIADYRRHGDKIPGDSTSTCEARIWTAPR